PSSYTATSSTMISTLSLHDALPIFEADRVSNAIKKPPSTVPALVKAYADDGEPWCLLDTHHRHMESRKYNFEFAASSEHHGLDKDRKSTRLNSSHVSISYAVFCLKK